MISRRNFLKGLAAGAAVYPFKSAVAYSKDEKTLNMLNIHTGESMDIKYYGSGICDRDAIDSINYLLRCHYTNEVKSIDTYLLDLLCGITNAIGNVSQVQIISGYRSWTYNEYLISLGRRVSRKSLHLSGLAVDFTIEGVSNDKISRIARSFQAGGVGYYPEFVHIDTGRIRYW